VISPQVTGWISLPAVGYGTAPTLDGKWLLVTTQTANQVAVVDLAKMTVDRTIPVGKDPVQILLRPDGQVAYVSCSGDGKVAAINLASWKVEKQIETGPTDALAWGARQ
jgi:YVTN family beta-propeller protein